MANLRSYCQPGLDVMFVSLNPPVQSNSNGHWFSGKSSRFFHLLHISGLITEPVSKATADEVVFGTTRVNYRAAKFGAVDLIGDLVETNSSKVKPNKEQVLTLLRSIHECAPRFVCIIHSKVVDAFNRHANMNRSLDYGSCGQLLKNCSSSFFVNYFPNGNNIADEQKIAIFRSLRDQL